MSTFRTHTVTTPLEHVALYPSEEVDAVPLLLMGGLALALAGAGLAALRHRDLVAG